MYWVEIENVSVFTQGMADQIVIHHIPNAFINSLSISSGV